MLQSLAHHALHDHDAAISFLDEALKRAEPAGFIRLFVDEGAAMASLLTVASARGIRPTYISRLLAAFAGEPTPPQPIRSVQDQLLSQSLVEPLSPRELEILRLVAQGLSNHDISTRLYLALSTVKGHNRAIYSKLDVQRRTEAVARAGELGLL